MNVLPTNLVGRHLLGEVPEPVLFNSWKHHAGALRRRLEEYAAVGAEGLTELAARLVVLGHELMDLYSGRLAPADIAEEVLSQLRAAGRLDPAAYHAWLVECGGYGVLTFPDQTRWVVRPGAEGDRYVHVHPARWAPQTRRVRANVLKTAVMVNAHNLAHGGDPLSVQLVNLVREKYLQLSPLRQVSGDRGLQPIIELLRSLP